MWYVYIVRCRDGSLYTGVTNDLVKRLAAHNAGRGAKYIKPRRPVTMVYTEKQKARGMALARECQIKRLCRRDKLAMIASVAK